MTGSREETGFSHIGMFGRPAGNVEIHRYMFAVRDVREHDDHAFRFLSSAAVGQDAPEVPGSSLCHDLPFDGYAIADHRTRIVQQRIVGRQRFQVSERPADITRDYVEQ